MSDSTPLKGRALLNKLASVPHLSKQEKAKACGYVKRTKSGKERSDISGFMQAVLAAKGLTLETERKDGRGKTATYRVFVHTNGQIVIGRTYTEMMGLQPGDEFEIKLGYKHIQLIKVDAE